MSVKDRFDRDRDFRHDQEELVWTSESVQLIDTIAHLPILDNAGRIRDDRNVVGDCYYRFDAGAEPSEEDDRFLIRNPWIQNVRHK